MPQTKEEALMEEIKSLRDALIRERNERVILEDKVFELETVLEVKKGANLKHLSPLAGPKVDDASPVLLHETSTSVDDNDAEYVEFDCMVRGFETIEKSEEIEKEDIPNEPIVRSLILRVKTKKRKAKDDKDFVYYEKDKKGKKKKLSTDVVIEKNVDVVEKLGKNKKGDLPSFNLNIDAIDVDDLKERDETPNKNAFKSLKTISDMLQYITDDEAKKVIETFFTHADRRLVINMLIYHFCIQFIYVAHFLLIMCYFLFFIVLLHGLVKIQEF